MSKYQVADIRNIALAGHRASGKTSLADALLFQAKAVDRRGSVDDGTSVSDYDEEEHKRHFSIDTSVLHLEYKGKHVHLLDTPGDPDFVGAALGRSTRSRTWWSSSRPSTASRSTPAACSTRPASAAWPACWSSTSSTPTTQFGPCSRRCATPSARPACCSTRPINPGPKFSGVVSVLNPPDSAAAQPAGCPLDLAAARSQLVDAVVEADEALMEKYLMEGAISADELAAALPKALAAGTVIPIFCTAAKKDKDLGIAELLDALADYALSPPRGRARRRSRDGRQGRGNPAEADAAGEFVGQVFKAITDKFVGNLSFIRVFRARTSPTSRWSTPAPASRPAPAACSTCRATRRRR